MPLPDFRPLPLLTNPHVQTALGTVVFGHGCPKPQRRHVVPLPDGDALLLHENVSRRWRPGDPVVLLVHGLSGWHGSPHIVRMAGRMLREGWRVFRIDLRGAAESVSLSRQTYHAGRTEDLREAVTFIHRLCGGAAVWMASISLGANMTLKLAAESAADPVPGLAAVAALNPPLDMQACAEMIARPENSIYEVRFVRSLLENARIRGQHFPESAPPDWDEKTLTIRIFDDQLTGPRAGYRDAAEYYAAVGAGPLVPRIEMPALIMTAEDDPFIDVRPFRALRCGPNVEVRIAAHGGHVGFVGDDGGGGVRWGERYVVEWLKRLPAKGRAKNPFAGRRGSVLP